MSGLSTALLAELGEADLQALADRLRPYLTPIEEPDRWLNAAEAAEHLGLSVHAIRRLAADPRSGLPVHQEREGCKLWFKRLELDEWRVTV